MKMSHVFFVASILLIAFFSEANASHIIGGQITAEAVSGQNFTYQIKFILYTDIGSEVAFAGSEIHLGVGESVYIDYEEVESEYLNEDSLAQKAIFVVTHTYPGPGEYMISYREYNRTGDIVNMRNSVFTPFYMESKLIIDPLIGSNNTPVLADPLSFDAHVKTRFIQNIGATDPDGDSLSYALVVPKQDMEKYVEGYYFPHRLGILSADPPAQEDGTLPALLDFENGQLVWNAPAYGGEYTIAFQVKEWRKVEGEWQEIGYVTRDFTIFVQDTIKHTHGSEYITDTQDEREPQAVVLFPNPTDGKFELILNEYWYNSSVVIQDILGRKVYEVPAIGQKTSYFDLPHLSTGLYVLLLQKGFKQRSFTFVKQ